MLDNLAILKPSVIDGGVYDEVRIFAETKINGMIQANVLEVYDDALFEGHVQVKTLKIKGAATFNGPVEALEIIINGSVQFNEVVKTNKLDVKNQVQAKMKVESYETVVDGFGQFTEFDGYQLTVNGQLTVTQLLRCNQITFTSQSRGKLKEVLSAIVSITPELYLDETNHKVVIDELLAYDVTIKHTYIRQLKVRKINQDEYSQIDHLDWIKG
jgi:cytoskeletal protein CcmA (bactofilin family)